MYQILAHGPATRVGVNIVRVLNPSITSTRSYASSSTLNVGDIVHGYKVDQVDYIKELNIIPILLTHQATGAQHLHVRKDGDNNNLFSVSLRTTPKNSTGAPHILEHLALCGSKRFAVRDPFFKMTTRSLATFMNAFTGSDFTAYPFSTQNPKDFENLLNIYSDAVFFPRLRPVDFRQEGWRLEHENPDRKDTPIVMRGVVYNEMKGVFSSSSAIYCRRVLNHLFPDTCYRYESGGDPESIPDLTHDDLKRFHAQYYHPSNAKFFTYGDIPVEKHLKILDETILSKFSENSRAREQSVVDYQTPWSSPKTVNLTCPKDPLTVNPDKQTTTSISYAFPIVITDNEEMFALNFLSTLLMDGPNSPFHKNLLESGIGSDYSPSSGLGNFTKQPFFSIGLQNIKNEDIEKVHEIILKTFEEVSQKGIPQERVDAVMHNIELNLKHNRGNFGLRLFMNLESMWNHDSDIIESLRINKMADKVKRDIADDKQYWKKMIDKYFLKNNHKLITNMRPDPDFEEDRKYREDELIRSRIQKLDEVGLRTVLYEGMELKKIHAAKEDPSILPCLDPSTDISRELTKTELEFTEQKGIHVQLCRQPTNEVVYFRGLIDLESKIHDTELLDYLPLFCDVSTRLGAGSYTRQSFSQKEQLTTGGLGVSLMINPSLSEFDKYKKQILIGSHCLSRNVSNMFELWANVFKQIHFQENKDYLLQLIRASAADLAEGVPHSGQRYAIKRSSSTLSTLSSLDERLSGLSFVARVKDMAAKEPVESIAQKLISIASIIFTQPDMKYAVTTEPDFMSSAVKCLNKFIDTIQAYPSESTNCPSTGLTYEKTKVENLEFPFATHYVAKSLIGVPKLHEDFAKLMIMSKLISSKYLLREVREKGGAYGVGLRVNNSGLLNFFSYRDPNTDATMDIFDRAGEWVKQGQEYNDHDIDESKLGVFQSVDAPIAPGDRGMSFFQTGETYEMRDQFRKRLLDVTRDDVVKVAAKYLSQEKVGRHII